MKAILRSGFLALAIMLALVVPVGQDEAESVKWYRMAAEQGDTKAQNKLGDIYYNGFGVLQDYAKAAIWYRKAAEQGDADAQNKLALMHVKGDGVPQDYVSAQMWFNIAAALGDEKAQKARSMVVDLMTPDQITAA